jgi:hypothetical protein
MESRGPRGFLNRYHRDYYGGALMVLIGLGAVFMGVNYQTGNLRHMGPGFFPVSVGGIIAFMGVLIALGARGQTEDEAEYLPPEWRGWICIVLSIVAFVVIGKFGGLLPATFAIVFISALGDRDNTIKGALLLALAMCVICVVVFWWALQLQFPLFVWGG